MIIIRVIRIIIIMMIVVIIIMITIIVVVVIIIINAYAPAADPSRKRIEYMCSPVVVAGWQAGWLGGSSVFILRVLEIHL